MNIIIKYLNLKVLFINIGIEVFNLLNIFYLRNYNIKANNSFIFINKIYIIGYRVLF